MNCRFKQKSIRFRVGVSRSWRVLLLSGCIFCCRLSIAANSELGTSGAQFLKIGVGARPAGMGESFVSVADDVNAVYYNPAGLGRLKKAELTAMHTQWFEGLNFDYGALALPSRLGTWGLSATTLKADDLEKRGNSETLAGSFDTVDAAYTLSLANKLGSSFYWGVTGRILVLKIDNTSAQTAGGDIGLLYEFSRRSLQFGVALKNMGSDIKFNEESDPQPFVVDSGISAKFIGDRLLVALNAKKPRDNDVLIGAGTEWNQKLPHSLRCALRGGYNASYTDPGDASGFSFGVGAGFKQLDIDFSWLPLGDLGNTFRYSARLQF